MEFKKTKGPAICWKCSIKLSSLDFVYEAESMTGRPSFTKEQFFEATPQFCKKCYEKINV